MSASAPSEDAAMGVTAVGEGAMTAGDAEAPPAPSAFSSWLSRMRATAERGPAVQAGVALALIWTVFTLAEPRFLSALNLTNLTLQIASVSLISAGIVLVLLLGEIDLSAAALSAMAAAVMAVLNVKQGWNPWLAILAALAVGAVVDGLQGAIFTRFAVPSFVVTLAGFIAWQGGLLAVLGDTGTLNVFDPTITGLTSTFLSPAASWAVAALAVAGVAADMALRRRARRRHGLPERGMRALAAAVVGLSVLAGGVTLVWTSNRGTPLAAVIVVAICMALQLMLTRTRFGRQIFAVGGNAEAARRAGIRINRVRITVFAMSGALAAAGGVLAASRLLAVNQNSGGGDLLLSAIAGPVIAGTSLFGGRGTIWSALLGALILGSISNGMDLLGLQSSVKLLVTGGVLLAAVVLDGSLRSGRADALRR